MRPWLKDVDSKIEDYDKTGEVPAEVDEKWLDQNIDDLKYTIKLQHSLHNKLAGLGDKTNEK